MTQNARGALSDRHYLAQLPLAGRELLPEADVILAVGGVSMQALFQSPTSVPIVFVLVLDPVGVGYVTSLAAPGGNITGFINYEGSIAGKWRVNRRSNLTPYRRPILTPLSGGF